MSTERIFSIRDFRERARLRLPKAVIDFIDGGADDELSLARNCLDFDRIKFLPLVLVDVSQRDLSASVLGRKTSPPIIIAPTSLAALVWPQAGILLARAAQRTAVPFTVSASSSVALEDIRIGAP